MPRKLSEVNFRKILVAILLKEAVGQFAIEQNEQRKLELQALIDKIAAMFIVVQHHQGPGSGGKVPAGERRYMTGDTLFQHLRGIIESRNEDILSWFAPCRLRCVNRAECHEIAGAPDCIEFRITHHQSAGLLACACARPAPIPKHDLFQRDPWRCSKRVGGTFRTLDTGGRDAVA